MEVWRAGPQGCAMRLFRPMDISPRRAISRWRRSAEPGHVLDGGHRLRYRLEPELDPGSFVRRTLSWGSARSSFSVRRRLRGSGYSSSCRALRAVENFAAIRGPGAGRSYNHARATSAAAACAPATARIRQACAMRSASSDFRAASYVSVFAFAHCPRAAANSANSHSAR